MCKNIQVRKSQKTEQFYLKKINKTQIKIKIDKVMNPHFFLNFPIMLLGFL